MSFISYAQNSEDVMLWRALKHIEKGFYIDVGANHPVDDSVTKALYDRGWHGINVEPEERFFALLEEERERDINLDVAVSNEEDDIKLYIFETRGWSTNSIQVAEQHQKEGYDFHVKSIRTKSLDQICRKYAPEEIHFLKIDVEGAEKSVLESFSFAAYRPWIIVIEATKPNTDIDISDEWEYLLIEHKYLFAYFDGINKFYVSQEHSELLKYFRYPPNVLDNTLSINQYRAEKRAEACEAQLERLTKEMTVQKSIADKTEQELHKILHSTSCKITEPLRRIKKMIFALRKKASAPLPAEGRKQLLIDVSQIYFIDNRTGIQRVIYNIIKELSVLKLNEYTLLPVYATPEKTYHYTSRFMGENKDLYGLDEKPVIVKRGDVFLGLDLTAHLFPSIEETLRHYKDSGVSIHYIVYDIIPLLHTEFSKEGMDTYFRIWLNGLVSYTDSLICISQSVAREVEEYIREHYATKEHLPKITFFHLGAGIGNYERRDVPNDELSTVLEGAKENLTFLMVGTIEPRKGHSCVLSAFEVLWAEGYDVNLVFAGKKGWRVEALTEKILHHPRLGKNLFWLQNINDSDLHSLYTSSTCLIMASYTEGFGLPIIEAAKYRLPVIARDIPVFREIGEAHLFYFKDSNNAEMLAKSLKKWIALYRSGTHPESDLLPWITWEESCLELLARIRITPDRVRKERKAH